MFSVLGRLWEEDGQDVAEYAVMLAVILAVVVGTIRMIGSNANNVFSSVGQFDPVALIRTAVAVSPGASCGT